MIAAVYARKSNEQRGAGEEHLIVTLQGEHAKALKVTVAELVE